MRTTIDPAIEQSVVAAMGNNYAGMVALDPATGGILGAAGVAFSAPQPPGSTMKIVTSTGVLEAGIARLSSVYPIATQATIDGFSLQNAGGEACGGTLLNAFAVSCNSVFAPLGVKLGAARLLAVAKRYGFDAPSSMPGEAESTIPPADLASSNLELGASAIGQGKVQATTLEMADVAATIADGGRRPDSHPAGRPAAQLRRRHLATDRRPDSADDGRGGQHRHRHGGADSRRRSGGQDRDGRAADTANANNPNASSPTNTDAWFVAFAPVGRPRIVVGALFPNQGAGGATAAPAVRQVLLAGLKVQ